MYPVGVCGPGDFRKGFLHAKQVLYQGSHISSLGYTAISAAVSFGDFRQPLVVVSDLELTNGD